MSIYSGFPTRQQQQTYDQYLETVLYVLQKRLLKFYKGQSADEQKFLTVLSKLYLHMKSMQNHKYLQPKSSNTFEQLVQFLKNRQPQKNPKKVTQSGNQTLQTKKFDSILQKNANQLDIMPATVPVIALSEKTEQLSNSQSNCQQITQKFTERDFRLREMLKQKQIKFKSRPITTQNQNRIRKRVSNKSNHSNNIYGNANGNRKDSLSYFDNQKQPFHDTIYNSQQKQQSQNDKMESKQKILQVSKKPLQQHILNPSAARFVKMIQKQSRVKNKNGSHFHKSYQQLQGKDKDRKSTLRSREKDPARGQERNREKGSDMIQHQNTEQNYQRKNQAMEIDCNVRDLIKGYINKSKKSYMKTYNRKKYQIDQMLKQI